MQKTNRDYISTYIQLQKECDTIYRTAAARMGLSDCAFWILYTLLDENKTYTQAEICDSASMPRQTVNSALKKLERDGLLCLRRLEGRKGKSIHLTEKGDQYVKLHIHPIMESEERACAQFSDQEKETFLRYFRMLTESLKQEIELAQTEEN